MIVFSIISTFAQQIDTLYYDKNWQRTEPFFAEYYRVVRSPHKQGYPFAFRDYWINGPLQSEGYVLKIDSMDDKQSIFVGKGALYHRNGRTKEEFTRNMQGQYHGEYKTYYENGEVQTMGYFENGVLQGEVRLYDANGILQSSRNYQDGQPYGEVQIFHPDGKPSQIFHINNGLIEGDVITYDERGIESGRNTFINGLPSGYYSNKFNESITTGVTKEINTQKGDSLRISISIKSFRLPTKRKTINSNGTYWNWNAKTSIYYIVLHILNHGVKHKICSFDNFAIKKVNTKYEMLPVHLPVLDESMAKEMFIKHSAYNIEAGYKQVHMLAKAAASTTTHSYRSTHTNTTIKYNGSDQSKYNSYIRSSAKDNSDYKADANSTKYSNETRYQNASMAGSSQTTSSISSSSINGLVYYDIYKREEITAKENERDEYNRLDDRLDLIRTSTFSIAPRELATKCVIGKYQGIGKNEAIVLTFTYNGHDYEISFNQDEICDSLK